MDIKTSNIGNNNIIELESKIEQLLIIIAEKQEEIRKQELAKMMIEVEKLYGIKCQAFGISKKDDNYSQCMMTMMQEENEKEQVRLENNLRMMEMELRIAEAEERNKSNDLKMAELQAQMAKDRHEAMIAQKAALELQKKAEEESRRAAILAQAAAEEQARQQNALLKKQLQIEEERTRQQGVINALNILQALQPQAPPPVAIPRQTRTTCDVSFGQLVCNTR